MQRAKPRKADQWLEVYNEYQKGAETEQEFCERRGIKIRTFRKWKYRLAAQEVAANTPSVDRCHSSGSAFVKVSVAQARVEPVRVVFNGISIECASRHQVGLTVEIMRGLCDGR